MDIGPLTYDDIPAALRLSTQAGWNQLDADWRRLLDLWPGLCLAGRLDGDVVATATLARYGGMAWVGMVLVDEAQRGKGLGGAIMNAAIALAAEAGIEVLGLDATDAGRPVYLKRGFTDAVPIERWVLPAGERQVLKDLLARPLHDEDWESLLALDRAVCGFDRSRLLDHLRREAGTACSVVSADGEVRAFGFRRPGRTADHIGPVVGLFGDDAVIESLAMTTVRAVILDGLSPMLSEKVLYRRGFQVARRLTRMYRGAAMQLSDQYLAAAGFELG